jgi:hypothetical protein
MAESLPFRQFSSIKQGDRRRGLEKQHLALFLQK